MRPTSVLRVTRLSVLCIAISTNYGNAQTAVSSTAPAEPAQQTTLFKGPPGTVPEDGPLTGRDDSGRDRRPFLGGIYPEDLTPLLSTRSPAIAYLTSHRVHSFGWVDGGFTSISGASGLVIEAPTSDRFSNQPMLNSAHLVVARSTTKTLSWGFRADFYVGSDAALLRPFNNFGPGGPRWGTDVRQAYLTLHTPGLSKRGIDWSGGRINNPTGYESLMAPYRPLYSESYYWIHYEVGSTGLQATLHPTSQFDLLLGTDMGYNTVFKLRGRAPDYIARAIYTPKNRNARQYLATVYTGPEPMAATAGHIGRWQTLYELQAREVWTPRIAQVLLVHYMRNTDDPAVGGRTSSTQGALAITAFKLNEKAYINTRLEWFSDPHGVRIATPGTYSEATVGLALHPNSWLNFKPELRGDFSGQRSFGQAGSPTRHRDQLSAGFEVTVKGHIF